MRYSSSDTWRCSASVRTTVVLTCLIRAGISDFSGELGFAALSDLTGNKDTLVFDGCAVGGSLSQHV